MPFDGETYERELDGERLATQLRAVKVYMLAQVGQWYSLAVLERRLGFPQASISARLRDLRKVKFGEWEVERRRVDDQGTHQYRMTGAQGHARKRACSRCQQLEGWIEELEREVAMLKSKVTRLSRRKKPKLPAPAQLGLFGDGRGPTDRQGWCQDGCSKEERQSDRDTPAQE